MNELEKLQEEIKKYKEIILDFECGNISLDDLKSLREENKQLKKERAKMLLDGSRFELKLDAIKEIIKKNPRARQHLIDKLLGFPE